MNVFEDLVSELKDENLLEETVIQTQKAGNVDEFLGEVGNGTDFLREVSSYKSVDKSTEILKAEFPESRSSLIPQEPADFGAVDNFSVKTTNDEFVKPDEVIYPEIIPPDFLQTSDKPVINGKEFYRKRAIEEVSGLQIVEHILSGVEREQNKSATKLYNDIAVKKSLHDFLQIDEDTKSPEHIQAEFQLMQETETWRSALSHRDKRISVAHLRRYCETTKPPLSSQALISLARFYHNLPYSESVRSKFDLVVTRLFSKDIGGEKRILAFSRNDLIQHFAELYAEWSSISACSADDEESQIVLTALKFEDLMAEVERADTFDELVNTDFFNRLRLLKESTGDVFYAPLITATTIESNIRIGNKYVDLIDNEREKSNIANLQDKYGFLHDQAISDSTSKTLQLVELLKEKQATAEIKKSEVSPIVKPAETKITKKPEGIVKKTKDDPRPSPYKTAEETKVSSSSANKWLLAATVLIIFIGFGLYFGVNGSNNKTADSTQEKKVNLENSSLKEYIQSARIKENTFYGVTLPAWDVLSLEKKEEILKKIQSSGSDKGYGKVSLVSKEGKAVGYATAGKAEVITP